MDIEVDEDLYPFVEMQTEKVSLSNLSRLQTEDNLI